MGDILFFIKMIVFTVVFILMMQIKIGPTTVEQKALHWIHTTSIMKPVHEVAQGGVIALKSLWNDVVSSIDSNVKKTFNSDNVPGKRSLGIELKRSQAYLKQAAEKAKEVVKEEVKSEIKKDQPVLWGDEEPAW